MGFWTGGGIYMPTGLQNQPTSAFFKMNPNGVTRQGTALQAQFGNLEPGTASFQQHPRSVPLFPEAQNLRQNLVCPKVALPALCIVQIGKPTGSPIRHLNLLNQCSMT